MRTFDFYSNLAKNYSVKGNQTDDSTRATYFAGKAAMIIWSSFILDEMAGLRKDALPSCTECKSVPSFLAQNSGVVTSIQGPDGTTPSSYGEIVVLRDDHLGAEGLGGEVHRVHDVRRLPAVARHRAGGQGADPAGHQARRHVVPGGLAEAQGRRGHQGAAVRLLRPGRAQAVQEAPETFSRWGLPQGQGALVGAMQGPLPVPKALADLVNGKGDATAAAQSAQKAVEDLQKDTN